jgi:hypothetical protein
MSTSNTNLKLITLNQSEKVKTLRVLKWKTGARWEKSFIVAPSVSFN